MNSVYVITYFDENNKYRIKVFDNPLAADACYMYCHKKYSDVRGGKCEVYGSFMVAGNKDE